jgi:hypothetical protein
MTGLVEGGNSLLIVITTLSRTRRTRAATLRARGAVATTAWGAVITVVPAIMMVWSSGARKSSARIGNLDRRRT